MNYTETILALLNADERNQYIRKLLSENDCNITFSKVDGSLRSMPCTLRKEVMPQLTINENQQTRVYKPETLSVWCLDKSEWRSFRVMNVTDIYIVD
jgi:hypothetical protein